MKQASLIRFIILGAIWGASFSFTRVVAPAVGAFWTSESRLFIGAAVLFLYITLLKIPHNLHHWKHYLVAGVLNCAVPFTMFSVAGKIIPAAYSATLNSSVPLWATIFGAVLLGDKITPTRVLALIIGVVGVIFVARPSADVDMTWAFLGGVGACLLAAACYALNTVYVKKYAAGVNSKSMATFSQAFGALLLLPLALASGIPDTISPTVLLSALALGALCSGVAFLLFYQLIDEIGPVMTSGVTFLIPVFGVLFSAYLLQEQLAWTVFAGCALIICAAFLLFRSNVSKS